MQVVLINLNSKECGKSWLLAKPPLNWNNKATVVKKEFPIFLYTFTRAKYPEEAIHSLYGWLIYWIAILQLHPAGTCPLQHGYKNHRKSKFSFNFS